MLSGLAGGGRGGIVGHCPRGAMEQEPHTRLFVVAGKNADERMLQEAFAPFGRIQNIKVIREKGVAYVTMERASCAARAIEALHETVLNDGRGPMVKVMFADSQKSGRRGRSSLFDYRGPPDPDNVPPCSRLFLVVPKTADGDAIRAEMAAFGDLQSCKTDLIEEKGVVYCKYSRSSSALRAMEIVQETSIVAGYKVKCMLAEPKGRRPTEQLSPRTPPSPMQQASFLDYAARGTSLPSGIGAGFLGGGMAHMAAAAAAAEQYPLQFGGVPLSSVYDSPLPGSYPGVGSLPGLGLPLSFSSNSLDAASMGGLGLTGLQRLAAMQGASTLNSPRAPLSPPDELPGLGSLTGLGALGPLSQAPPAAPPPHANGSASGGSQSRSVHVAVHGACGDAALADLCAVLPGFEACEVLQQAQAGQRLATVTYKSPAEAAEAALQLDGVEFPPDCGLRLRASLAEQLAPPGPVRLPTNSYGVIGDGSSGSSGLPALRPGARAEAAEEAAERRLSLSSRDPVLGSLGSLESNPGSDASVRTPLRAAAHAQLPPRMQPASMAPTLNPSPPAGFEPDADGAESNACRVVTLASRPLQPGALQQLLAPCGPVRDVLTVPDDPRCSVVRFASPAAASQAVQRFNGASVCGETLRVLPGQLLPSPGLV